MNPDFTDFNALQRFNAHVLLSDPWLNEVNMAMRHELLDDVWQKRLPDKTLAAEVLIYITPRNKDSGRKGAGIIIERPEFSVQSPNVTGPQGDITCEFLILSDRGLNESPKLGTGRTSNMIGQRILDLFHRLAEDECGTFQASGKALETAKDWEPLDAYRAKLIITMARNQTQRCARVVATIDGANVCTLTCATSDANIWYTLSTQDADGNWITPATAAPSNTAGGAQLYNGPFPIASGQQVRTAAFSVSYNQSPITRKTAP